MSDALAARPAEVDVDRLRSRLERERRARRQAEMIAERGMRELWESNRDLQDRVAKRTAELERVTSALEFAHVARLRAINELVDDLTHELAGHHIGLDDNSELAQAVSHMRSLTEPLRTPDETVGSGYGAVELTDRLVERWQRSAAKRGQLLTVEERDSTVGEIRRWPQMLAVADTLIGAVVRLGGGGAAAAVVTARSTEATISVGGSSLAVALEDADPGDAAAPFGSPVRAEFQLAAKIAGTVDGRLEIALLDGGLGVVVSLPQSS